MATFKGLLYVEHEGVGTKSEGPAYYLQTTKGDFLLNKKSTPWQPDYHLEFYSRRMVEVGGELAQETIKVENIREILAERIPPQ